MSWDLKPGRIPKLCWTQKQKDKDLSEGVPDTERTMEIVREMASTIIPGINFTVDIHGRYTE